MRPVTRVAVAVEAVLVAAAIVVGAVLNGRHVPIHADAAPLYAVWLPHLGPGTPLAVAVAAAVLRYGFPLARRLAWQRLALTGYLTSLLWTVGLALVDGWSRGIATRLTPQAEYLHDAVYGTRTHVHDTPVRDIRGSVVRFDIAHSEVVATIPRHAIYAQMVYPDTEPTLAVPTVWAQASVATTAVDVGGDFTYTTPQEQLSFAACDRARGYHPTTAPLDPAVNHVSHPAACRIVVTDPSGDTGGTEWPTDHGVGGDAAIDITRVTYRIHPHTITVTLLVPDLAARGPVWNQEFDVEIGGVIDEPAGWTESGYERGTTGSKTTGDQPPLHMRIDDMTGVVSLTVPRTEDVDRDGLLVASRGSEDQLEQGADDISVQWSPPARCSAPAQGTGSRAS